MIAVTAQCQSLGPDFIFRDFHLSVVSNKGLSARSRTSEDSVTKSVDNETKDFSLIHHFTFISDLLDIFNRFMSVLQWICSDS